MTDTLRTRVRARARSRARVPLAAALALLAALALAACGTAVSTGSFKGESHAVAQRISDFQTDATAADQAKLCQRDLAAAVKTRLRTAGSDCQAAFKHQLKQIDTVELTIESIAVAGASATARVKSTWSGKSAKSTLHLVKEGGAWRIAALG